jgi:hypothetical protein
VYNHRCTRRLCAAGSGDVTNLVMGRRSRACPADLGEARGLPAWRSGAGSNGLSETDAVHDRRHLDGVAGIFHAPMAVVVIAVV